jgi:hypothetical protein
MRKLILVLLTSLIFRQLCAQDVEFDNRLTEAYTSSELLSLSSEQVEYLTVLAEKMCYFQPVKDESTELYNLQLKNGQSVVLTPEQISNFNPLIYSLPQDQLACINYIIEDTNGAKHLLVIRSVAMIENDVKRIKEKKIKSGK